jgi:hypothetical protein
MKAIAWTLASIMLPLLVTEFTELGPWLAERLVRWSVRMLPPEHRDRYVDEWLAELESVPGKVLKLIVAARLALRVPATRLAVQGITFPQALRRAMSWRLNKSGVRLVDRASRLSRQPASGSSQRYMAAWFQRNLRELQVNLLRSAAIACFTVALSLQFVPFLRMMGGESGLIWYLKTFPRVRILGEDRVYVDFGGPKEATHSVQLTYSMTIHRDEK